MTRPKKAASAPRQRAGRASSEATVRDAARTILRRQYKVVCTNQAAAIRGQDPDALHDIRVAIRRFRAALKLFKKPLKATGASGLDKRLRRLNRDLGRVRDAHVWMDRMTAEAVLKAVGSDPGWQVYLDRQQAMAKEWNERLCVMLKSKRGQRVLRDMERLIRKGFASQVKPDASVPVAPFMARRLLRVFDRIRASAFLQDEADPEAMHELRRLCRRERYWCEFGVRYIGGDVGRLGRRLKAVADALGRLHDAQVAMARIATDTDVPDGLARYFVKAEERALRDFRRSWDRIFDRALASQAKRCLKAARGR